MTVVYRQTKQGPIDTKSAFCPECGSTRLIIGKGKLTCTNCDHVIGSLGKTNKYGAKRTEFKGKIYDSKFEATKAAELELLKNAGEILDYETQFKVRGWLYREDGSKAFEYKHKVDFRVHHKDGSFELIETKGVETEDYKWRRKCLENDWLPRHLDHDYTVEKQNGGKYGRKKY